MILLVLALFVTSTVVAETHKFVACHTRPCERPSGKRPKPRLLLPTKNTSVVTSGNWSGYVAAPNLSSPRPLTVSVVGGSWTVPNVQVVGQDTWCSMWVGIDGAGSPSVEQIGTEHDVKNGVVSHYAWYEMFPAGSNEIVGFPVDEGDQITASVVYVPLAGVLQPHNDLFILQIFNNTKRVYTSIAQITTTSMQRLCAEWIVEAPWMNKTLPLSDFGTAFMFNCTAIINGVAGAINNPAWQNESMNMVAPDGTSKAVTSALSADGKSFSVQWLHV